MPETVATEHQDVLPYRARAVYAGERWHLAVVSLDDHPDRGDVDSVAVTLAPTVPGAGRPPAALDSELRDCGFDRHGEWVRDGEGWSTPCVQSDPLAAPATEPPQ